MSYAAVTGRKKYKGKLGGSMRKLHVVVKVFRSGNTGYNATRQSPIVDADEAGGD